MKKINLTFLFVALISICIAQNISKPASSNIRGVQYPQITSGSQAVFKIKAPEVQKLQLDLGKKYDMIRNSNGVWEITTDSLSEGFHYYSLIIDGVAVADPASESFYGMGRMASGIEVPFKGDGYYQIKNVPHGDIRIKRYFSNVTNGWRDFYMYTPPGYDQNTSAKYPVLYILHGGGEDQRGHGRGGETRPVAGHQPLPYRGGGEGRLGLGGQSRLAG